MKLKKDTQNTSTCFIRFKRHKIILFITILISKYSQFLDLTQSRAKKKKEWG